MGKFSSSVILLNTSAIDYDFHTGKSLMHEYIKLWSRLSDTQRTRGGCLHVEPIKDHTS